MGKNLSSKYGQKLLDSVRKSTTYAIKTASKRAIEKTAKASGYLIGKKLLIKSQVLRKNLQSCIQKIMRLMMNQK